MRSRADRAEDQVASPSPGPARIEAAGTLHGASRLVAWLLGVGGLVGFAAAVTLLIEKIALLEDPTYVPSCSINPILSCGSVMSTEQAEVFGFPNPIIGVAGFAIVTTVGVALVAGARLQRWFWWGLDRKSTRLNSSP